MKAAFKFSALAVVAGLIGLSALSGPAAQAQGGADLLKQVQPTPEALKTGETLFTANCVSCHGPQGKGDGLAAAALTPKPRNFHAKTGWKNGQDFAGMFKTLEEGVPGSAMGSFNHLPAKDRIALIHYIRSLEASNFPAITAQDVETLQKSYNLSEQLSKGGAQAIPVDKAIEILIKEAEPQQARVKAALARLMAGQDKGSHLIMDSTSNPERALTMLVNAGNAWKGSVQDFSQMVMMNADTNGFRAVTGSYGSGQWQELQNALKKLL
ncbi:MAG: cytochrome c [Candidatus Sericytochromatia bacterium]